MLYKKFMKDYLAFKDEIDSGVKERLPLVKWPKGINKTTHWYNEDNVSLHQFNMYKSIDLYNKENPLIIDIHGGAGVYGDKDLNDLFCMNFTLRGYNVVAPSYRLLDKYNLVDQVRDLFSFLHYIEDNTYPLGIRFNKVMLTGDSAGGFLALLIYVVNKRSDLQELFNVTPVKFKIHCLVLNHPVCDLSIPMYFKNREFYQKHIVTPGLLRTMYGKHYQRSELYKLTSTPDKLLSKSIDINNVLIVTSSADEAFHPSSKLTHEAFNKHHIKHDYYLELDPSCSHVFNHIDQDAPKSVKCNDYIAKFFDKCE